MNPQLISFIDNYIKTQIRNIGFHQLLASNNWGNQWVAALATCQDANQVTIAINNMYQQYLQQSQQARQQHAVGFQQPVQQFNYPQMQPAPQFQPGMGFQQVPQPNMPFSRLQGNTTQAPAQPLNTNLFNNPSEAELFKQFRQFMADANKAPQAPQQPLGRPTIMANPTNTSTKPFQSRSIEPSGNVTKTVTQQDYNYDASSYDGILSTMITRLGVNDKIIVSKAQLHIDTPTSGETTGVVTFSDLQSITSQDVSPNESIGLKLDRVTQIYEAVASARHWINPVLNTMATSFVNRNNYQFCNDGTVITDLSADGCDLIELVNRNSTNTNYLNNLLDVLDAAAVAYYTVGGVNEEVIIVDEPADAEQPTVEPGNEDTLYARNLTCLVYYKHNMSDDDLSAITFEHSKLFDKPNWYNKLNATTYSPYVALICSSSGVYLLTLAKTESGIDSSLQQLLSP